MCKDEVLATGKEGRKLKLERLNKMVMKINNNLKDKGGKRYEGSRLTNLR